MNYRYNENKLNLLSFKGDCKNKKFKVIDKENNIFF